MSLDPAWFERAPWMRSSDGEIVAGGLLLLRAAWESAGTLSAIGDDLAYLARMAPAKLAANRAALLYGFETETIDGEERVRHAGMAKLLATMESNFGAQLSKLVCATAVVAQGGETFELFGAAEPVEAPWSARKGKRRLPADFGLTPELQGHLVKAGYLTPEHQAFFVEEFIAWAHKDNAMYSDWLATARNNLNASQMVYRFKNRFGFTPGEALARRSTPRLGGPGGDGTGGFRPRGGAQSFEDQARDGGNAAVRSVLETRFGGVPDIAHTARAGQGGHAPQGTRAGAMGAMGTAEDVSDATPRRPAGFGFGAAMGASAA